MRKRRLTTRFDSPHKKKQKLIHVLIEYMREAKIPHLPIAYLRKTKPTSSFDSVLKKNKKHFTFQ